MKTVDLNYSGKKFKLCFNLTAMMQICERYGDYATLLDTISKGTQAETMSAFIFLASALANGGADYEALFGREANRASYEEFMALGGLEDFTNVRTQVLLAMQSEAPTVKIGGQKNAVATVENE